MQTIPVYYINLDRSPDRRAFMEDQFEKLGLSATRIAAVDGFALNAAQMAGAMLPPGELGCFMSHRLAWKAFLDTDKPHAIILEDDVRLGEYLSMLASSSRWIPDDADIVRLETLGRRIGISTAMRAIPGGNISRLLTRDVGTAGYLLNRREAARLLSEEPMIKAVDLIVFSTKAVTERVIYQAVPALVEQLQRVSGTFESTLLEERRRIRKARIRPALLKRIPREIVRIWRKRGIPLVVYLTNMGRVRFAEIEFRQPLNPQRPPESALEPLRHRPSSADEDPR
jgi:glycosyl transferase family 25